MSIKEILVAIAIIIIIALVTFITIIIATSLFMETTGVFAGIIFLGILLSLLFWRDV